VFGRAVAQLLQALARRRDASAQSFLDFSLGWRMALHLDRRANALQVKVALDLTHQHLVASVVMAVRGDAAIKADAVRQQVHVFVFGIHVARHQVLVVLQSHAVQVALGDPLPLFVIQMFAWRGR
jgi:hypothetical protein